MVKGVPCGQGGVAVFEKGQAYEVIAGDCQSGFMTRRDADDAALTTKAGGDVEVVVDVESHALGAA